MIGEVKKVKSIQMFRKPVTSAKKGDWVGICVTNLDSKLIERAVVTFPGMMPNFDVAVVYVKWVIYYKPEIKTKSKLHITLGHQTVMGTMTFFSTSFEDSKIDLEDDD